MSHTTSPALQKQIIYCIYVRNHTPEGTFNAIIPDLDRIKALGTDIIWFLPIHPIGEKGKKGSLGCPYANRDYRTTNPAYGTMEDFRTLCDEIHNRGMKVMIDVVYNHTSPDSTLSIEHPEFFWHNPDGSFGNKIGDWADVIDLDYRNRDLWDYQIDSLKMWAGIVDGFRCDVASFVPLDFWKKAREEVEKVRPGCIWLAETVHKSFGTFARSGGFVSEKDTDMFEAFDIEYDYDIREVFDAYLKGRVNLCAYTEMLNLQEALYPDNYNKMRGFENHDNPRVRSFVNSEKELKSRTAFMYFLKGTTLTYAGQEWQNDRTPSLFEKEVITRDKSLDISDYMATLAGIKKQFGESDWFYSWAENDTDTVLAQRGSGDNVFFGVFPLREKAGHITLPKNLFAPIPDGEYRDMISGGTVTVKKGEIVTDKGVIVQIPQIPC